MASSTTTPVASSSATPPPRPSASHAARSYDIVVVGAGVAGSALAYSLGTAGRRVLLLERDLAVPDRIVGELLQPGGCAALRQLGMGDCIENIDAVPVEGYYICYNGNEVQIPYPESPAGKGVAVGETPSGRIEGRSFVHGQFINKLRLKASACENVSLVQATVKSLITCPNSSRVIGVSTSIKAPSFSASSDPSTSSSSTASAREVSFYAPLTIIADGCFSRFRSPASPAPTTRSHFVGLVLEDAPLPMPHHGTVVLAPNAGPILLYQIASHETRMLVDVKGKLPSIGDGSLKRHLEETILPVLRSEGEKGGLRGAVKRALDESESIGGDKRLRVMPNSWLPARQQAAGSKTDREGCIVVGDAWNMRHPLTGGGMTVALHDCLHLTRILSPRSSPSPFSSYSSPSFSLPSSADSEALLTAGSSDDLDDDLADWAAYAPELSSWHWQRKKLASVVNVLSVALYDLFGADDPNLMILQSGCFKYFQLGGEAIAGPVSLLSALAPKPLLLFYHFFAVALYSIWCMFVHARPIVVEGEKGVRTEMRKPSVLEYPGLVVKSWMVFYAACVVFLPVIWDEIH